MTGKMFSEAGAKASAILVFVGFNFTFFPQFLLGYLGMPRRYHAYPAEPIWQVLNVLSSAGASILALGYLLPAFYFTYSLFKGKAAPANPWGATGLEWQVPSPPPTFNFDEDPVVNEPAYHYKPRHEVHVNG
jgi:cytochrome c oxidase subunit 1